MRYELVQSHKTSAVLAGEKHVAAMPRKHQNNNGKASSMKSSIIGKGLGVMGLLLAAAIMLSSCASNKKQPVLGASQEKYILGTYSAVFACDLRMMDKAVRETCAKARLTELNRTNNMNACEYLYKDINNIRLHITLDERKDGTVKIKMKIGPTGDKESSQLLLIEIDNNLRAQGGNM